MTYDIQKASITKRISAFLFDSILTGIVIVAVALLLSWLLGYDGYDADLKEAYAQCVEYDLVGTSTQEEYMALDVQQQAIIDDYVYNSQMIFNIMLVIVSIGTILSFLLLEFVVPMVLGNGQTLGKKIFGIALVRIDGVKINNIQLFTRTILGKCTIETMIPLYILILMLFSLMGIVGPIIVCGLLIAQAASLLISRNNCALHDHIACTIAVDMASQRIFETTDDLIAYQKRVAAEKATRQPY